MLGQPAEAPHTAAVRCVEWCCEWWAAAVGCVDVSVTVQQEEHGQPGGEADGIEYASTLQGGTRCGCDGVVSVRGRR